MDLSLVFFPFSIKDNVLCRFLVPFIQGRLVLDFLSPSSKTNLYWIPCSHDPRQICTGFLVTITKGGLVQLYQILHSHNSRHSCTGLHVTIFQGRLVLDSMFPSSETNLCWISPSLYLRQLYWILLFPIFKAELYWIPRSHHQKQTCTVEPHSNGPAFNGIPPITNTNS